MQVVREDPVKFHTEEGGWSFLNPESSSEEEEEEAAESSEFEPEESEEDDEVCGR